MAAKHRSDVMLLLIGGFKLVKAALLLTAGIVLLARSKWPALRELAHSVGFDANHYLATGIAKLRSLDRTTREEIGIALLCYSALFVVEGVGLVLRRVWAEYFTVVITGSFIPFEIYELIDKRSALKGVVVAINIAAVGYLLWRLRRDKHWPWRDTALSARS